MATDLFNGVYPERIGGKVWEVKEARLHIHDDVELWTENPRRNSPDFSDEIQIEDELRAEPQYDRLKTSIKKSGQLTPVFVRKTPSGKYSVVEGNTRVTILRELDRETTNPADDGKWEYVLAKILPQTFTDKDINVLLGEIHVGAKRVRTWSRFKEARFVYNAVKGEPPAKKPTHTPREYAEELDKSEAWVSRYKIAYEFALKFIEYFDDEHNPDERQRPSYIAKERFSQLEEICRAKDIGPNLRQYGNPEYDQLRADVFEMVRAGVFADYRDARFIKEFYANEDIWNQLKEGEKGAAKALANDLRNQQTGASAKIAAATKAVLNEIKAGSAEFDQEDISGLKSALDMIQAQTHVDVHPYRIDILNAKEALMRANPADVKQISASEMDELRQAFDWFADVFEKYGAKPAAS